MKLYIYYKMKNVLKSEKLISNSGKSSSFILNDHARKIPCLC